MRHAIDDLAQILQRLTVFATLLGNHAALQYLRNGWDVKEIFDQKWWNHCLLQFTTSKTCAYDHLRACRASFSAAQILPTEQCHLGDLLSATARTLVTNARNGVTRAFHAQLGKFVKRLLARYELDNGGEEGLRARAPVTDTCLRIFNFRFFSNKRPRKILQDFPDDLLQIIDNAAVTLRGLYPQLTKCGKAEWIKPHHHADILRLLFELHLHRDAELAQVMADEQCTEEEVHTFMGRGCLRAFKLLPLADYEVKYVPISSTVLWTCLLPRAAKLSDDPDEKVKIEAEVKRQAAIKREVDRQNKQEKANMGERAPKRLRLDGDRKVKRAEEMTRAFLVAFPGLKRGLRKPGNGTRKDWHFANHVDSDGVGCSVHYLEREEAGAGGDADDGGCKAEGRDLEAKYPPVAPIQGQRVVGVDPGRRDMVFAVEPQSGEQYKMSTRCHAHEACRSVKTSCKGNLMSRTMDPLIPAATLKETVDATPTSKGVTAQVWRKFLDYVVPRVDNRCRALQARSLRRARFLNYVRRDRSLGHICQGIVSLANACVETAESLPALVAYGDGTRTFTGFGYTPAPQKRLRHRLASCYGAHVTLIHEANTSQVCHRCDSKLVAKHGKTWSRREKKLVQREITGVRFCPCCKITGKTCMKHPLHLHRDENAARNMVRIYNNLVAFGERPEPFRRFSS